MKPIIGNMQNQIHDHHPPIWKSEKLGGIIMLACTIISILLTNLNIFQYINFWNNQILGHSLTQWINDGLMAIFFLAIGLELENEIYSGELSNFKNALLPIFAAFGGMIIPAGIYYFLNAGSEYQSGAGIPMATDIAFALGILALLGKRVPKPLKLFIMSLAIIDDLGSILSIAIFYSKTLNWMNLGYSLGIFWLLILLKQAGKYNPIIFISGGILMWYFMLHSGIHATITGVLFAFVLPYKNGKKLSPSAKMQANLHVPVSYIIIPIFCLANTCISLHALQSDMILTTNNLGIILGLLIGKPLGICLFSYLAIRFKLGALPNNVQWKHIFSISLIAGIGFTMAFFISNLAFQEPKYIESSKISILIASLFAGIFGLISLHFSLNNTKTSV